MASFATTISSVALLALVAGMTEWLMPPSRARDCMEALIGLMAAGWIWRALAAAVDALPL